MAAALQIWSTFSRTFDNLPASVRAAVQRKVDLHYVGNRREIYKRG